MKNTSGDQIKTYYEDVYRHYLIRKMYTIIRIDGRAFHSFTRRFERPFDLTFVNLMDETAKYLCKNIQGVKFAFAQSDEISLVITDFENPKTDMWFGGNIQKIVSVSASMTTLVFNSLLVSKNIAEPFPHNMASFDSRVFQIPSKNAVIDYFIWRQMDASRNSLASVAQSVYLAKELNGKNSSEQHEMLFEKGINWSNYDLALKNGRLVVKDIYSDEWIYKGAETIAADRSFIENLLPDYI